MYGRMDTDWYRDAPLGLGARLAQLAEVIGLLTALVVVAGLILR